MDTDSLTPMAYEIILRAGKILDELHSEIGASAAGKKAEDDFLRGVKKHLRGILKSPEEYLDYWNYLDEVDVRKFREDIRELLTYVEEILSTPSDRRGEPLFE